MRSIVHIARGAVVMAMLGCGFALPAQAEVKSLVLLQEGEICPYMRAVLPAPAGWAEENSTCEQKLTVLVPKGTRLGRGPAAIYARATANSENLTVDEFVRNSQDRWRAHVRDSRITPLGEVARTNGGPGFRLFRYDNPSHTKQPVEFGAFTLDTDDKGNTYRVMIMLTAKSEAALRKAESAYRAMLRAY